MSPGIAPGPLSIDGPAGPLEALLELPAQQGRGQGTGTGAGTGGAPSPPRAFGVVCHPHPLFGGTMTNKVVHTVARAFTAQGAATLRFNFRGTGGSAGSYDAGRGETADLLAVVAWGRAQYPDLPLWLGGFSFGSFVALNGQAAAGAARLVTVAPPLRRWDFSAIEPPSGPWLVIQGDQDELVDHREVQRWIESLPVPPQLALLPGAEHFFHGRLHEIKDLVALFVAE